ncbi:MAG: response regulator [Hyphomicrobiaceae bacterium]|nr:MAG: response regulator [Hyphomicrobiaceae bacterium]
MSTPTVYLIDDQEAVRSALSEMLRVFGYSVEAYESADAFLQGLSDSRRGCIVADVRMPGMDGIELVRELSRRQANLPVVLISGHADVPMAVAAIKAGAEDFIEKPVDDAHLLAAINRCLTRVFGELSLERSLQELRSRLERLTPREIEVMDLVVQGFTSQAIALRLGISQRTVESYRVQIMEKMQAESVAVLVRQAIRVGRITP